MTQSSAHDLSRENGFIVVPLENSPCQRTGSRTTVTLTVTLPIRRLAAQESQCPKHTRKRRNDYLVTCSSHAVTIAITHCPLFADNGTHPPVTRPTTASFRRTAVDPGYHQT
jgi:hypothetical protein